MKSPEVVVIDYGMGNLLSVQRGLEYCGATAIVTSDPELILSAQKVILPGVGAFSGGMAELQHRGLDVVVQKLAAQGVPLLGICLGMQMLLDESEEFGLTKGLGLIHGRVIPIPATTTGGFPQKIPHIGWNALVTSSGRESWNGTLLQKIKPSESVYFVHSFMAKPNDPQDCIAETQYGGRAITAVIEHGNVFGCQFHPEKSGEVGLRVLRRFLEL